jgi:hypothetical protein
MARLLVLSLFAALFFSAPLSQAAPSAACLILPVWAQAGLAPKCDSNADCPGFANSCFAGQCTSKDDNQCDSNADCPGFANSCFAGHCTSKDTNQCDSNKDCPGFANSCFAGHCTNP